MSHLYDNDEDVEGVSGLSSWLAKREASITFVAILLKLLACINRLEHFDSKT